MTHTDYTIHTTGGFRYADEGPTHGKGPLVLLHGLKFGASVDLRQAFDRVAPLGDFNGDKLVNRDDFQIMAMNMKNTLISPRKNLILVEWILARIITVMTLWIKTIPIARLVIHKRL